MKPLTTYKRLLIWFCGCFSDKSISKSEKFAHVIFTLSVFLVIIFAIGISAAFFYKFVSIDLESSLYTIFQISSMASAAYLIVFLFFSRYKITKVLDDLMQMYSENENDCESLSHLVQANDTSEWMWEIYIKYGLGGFAVSQTSMSIISVVRCFMIYDSFNTNHLYLSYKTITPWNQKIPVGYLADIIVQVLSAEAYLMPNGLLLLLFISLCLHHQAFGKIFEHSLRKVNRNDMNPLIELIQFHISTKNWFFESANFFSPYIVIQLICSMIMLSDGIFQMDLAIRHIGFEIGSLLVTATAGVTNLLLYCYFGKLATESYLKMSDCLYESNWTEFSIEQQKYLIFMMKNSQTPLQYHGFGVAVLNLETFCRMIKTVFSYYMMFKTLTTD